MGYSGGKMKSADKRNLFPFGYNTAGQGKARNPMGQCRSELFPESHNTPKELF
jgi:hypothetical protein